jgi:hypothetical protein
MRKGKYLRIRKVLQITKAVLVIVLLVIAIILKLKSL